MEAKSYEKAVNSLYGLQKFGIKFGLSNTANLLEALGNPHKNQRYIHIAGTNGKGSVAAFIASILKEAGLKVGLYTSPHLLRFTERFKINGVEMPQHVAVSLIEELQNAFVPEEPPTFFEAVTAMALAYFARENTDIAIMEVGMGGRLDATNIITPMVSVITNICMEHQYYLGNTLLEIANEKAGIIKEGVDVVTGASSEPVLKLFASIAKEKKAPFWRVGSDIRYRSTESGLHYYGIKEDLHDLQLGLMGSFQHHNAALALSVIEILRDKGLNVSTPAIREGLKKTFWPGRMQVVEKDPTIILDGAHNAAAARTLADSIKKDIRHDRVILVIGIMADKDIGAILRGIVPVGDYVIFTRPAYSRAAAPQVLEKEARSLNKPGEVIENLKDAILKAKKMALPNDLIVVCGSLFTVGEAMSCLNPTLSDIDSPI